VLLGLVAALRRESDYVVWGGVSSALGGLEAVVEDEPLRDQIDRFGHWLVEPNVERLGWQAGGGESSFDRLMRPMVLQQAVRFDNQPATAEARRRFDVYMDGGEMEPDLRAVALYAAARHGGAAEFDAILERYRQEQSPQVKMSLLAALGRFRQRPEIERFLALGLSPDVRPQDIFMVIAWGFRNREARDLTWAYVKDNWSTFVKRYSGGGHMLERFPTYAAWGFATHKMATEIDKFFREHPHPVLTRPTAQAVEAVGLKADWWERDRDEIKAFLQKWARAQAASE
jgi:aminopeptidase N